MLDTPRSEVECKTTGYPLHSPVPPPIPLPSVAVCHQVSTELYLVLQRWTLTLLNVIPAWQTRVAGVHQRSRYSSVTGLTRQDVCMGLARVAERTFSFEIGSVCTNQKLYKYFVLCWAIVCFSQRKMWAKLRLILCSWHRNIIISILKCAALLGRCPLSLERTTHESSFVSSELFKNCIWNLDPFRLQAQTPVWFYGDFYSCPSRKYSAFEMWWHAVTHGKGSEREIGERSG